MSELLEWNQNQKTAAYEKASKFQQKMQKQLEEVKLERDNLIKKAGKKGAQVEQELGVLDETQYNYLPDDILQ